MATSLAITVQALVQWQFQNTLTGSINTNNNNQFSYSKSLTNGTGAAGTADLLYAVKTTIAGGASTTLDLAGVLSSFFGATITMARVKFFFINLTSDTTASSVSIGNAAVAPIINYISDGTVTLKVYNDGIWLQGDGGATAYPITATTADLLKILNNDGTNTATLQIAIVGSSA